MPQNIQLPKFIYGTAWKGAMTTELVKMAVKTGFHAIDTANQPKHYSEPAVGDALLQLQPNGIQREQLFLQTKFTLVDGHNENIPYDPAADYPTQVNTSFQSSLQNLKTDYVDSYLLHGPSLAYGLGEADWEVWRAIEKIYESKQARLIGISNVNLPQLKLLTQQAKIKPMIVQNRCFANRGWDLHLREFCKAKDIIYQGFSLLTANIDVLRSTQLSTIAQRFNKNPAQIIFKFAMQSNIVPLTGTTSEQHMVEDLKIDDFELTPEDIALIASMALVEQ